MTSSKPSRVAFAVHTEMLHLGTVSERTLKLAQQMRKSGLTATFFVYPHRATVAGGSVRDQIQRLRDLGHEIGQHTHFYLGDRVEPHNKATDARFENAAVCIRRDYEFLQQLGITPRGFTSGGWIISEDIQRLLARMDFRYDCSVRATGVPPLPGMSNDRAPIEASIKWFEGKRLVCLPTSSTLGQWVKRLGRVRIEGPVKYVLAYIHDYDLLQWKNKLLPNLFLHTYDQSRFVSVGDLAGELERVLSSPNTNANGGL
jgi:peptidoglycan/xylan/chitin deacetylase (PgdA/CDA1 family)